MNVAIVYLDALGEGGYPRDVRALAGSLASRGIGISLVAKAGPRTDGLGPVTVVEPGMLQDLSREIDLLHLWGLFIPRQVAMCWPLRGRVRTLISPTAHLMSAHVQIRRWKKIPYLGFLRTVLSRWSHSAHVFSKAECDGVSRYLHPKSSFEASLGIFSPPTDIQPRESLGDYLLFLGRNDVYQKGIDLLLHGYALAAEEGLRRPLFIAGQPHAGSQDYLNRVIDEGGLGKQVHVVGPVSESRKWEMLSEARCLIFPSRWDGPPRPVREALALDTPVIVTEGTNLADIVRSSGAGTAVGFDARHLAAALLESEREDALVGWKEGARSLHRSLSWEQVGQQYLEGYEDTVSV